MLDAINSSEPGRDPEDSGGRGPAGLADYRADRDDFSRLLYLVYQEVLTRKEASQKDPA